MPLYDVFKIFRLGAKAGEKSKHPIATLNASSLSKVKELFSLHEKFRKGIEYSFSFSAKQSENDFTQILVETSAKTKDRARDPLKCEVGEIVWLQLNPFAEEEPYVEGKIYEVKSRTDEDPFPVYTIWVTGDYASWRWRKANQILTKKPKQAKHILAKLNAQIAEEEAADDSKTW